MEAKNIERAKDSLGLLKTHTEELVSLFEEAVQVSGGLTVRELGEWKVLFKETREHFKEHKSKFGGFNVKLDFALVDRMVAEGHEHLDIGTTRLYADVRGFFDVDKGHEIPSAFKKVEVDQEALAAYCDQLLKDGQPLPKWVKRHLQPTVNTRRIKGG